MNKIKVKIKQSKKIYIHNDLWNAAHFLKKQIESDIESDDREGISIKIMACLTMIAFATEARFNFLGFKLIEKWNERQPYMSKIKAVIAELNDQADFDERPYKTIQMLKEFRDTLAHGKPIEIDEPEKELIGNPDEFDERRELNAEWEKFLSEEFLHQTYEDIESVWHSSLEQSDLRIYDTMTRGEFTLQFIEHVEEK